MIFLAVSIKEHKKIGEKKASHNNLSGLSHPFLGMGPRAGIGKISSLKTKIGKIYIVFMYEVSIARLTPIVNLTLFLDIMI